MSAEAMQTAAGFVQQLASDLNNDALELPMIPDSVIRIQRAFQAEEVDLDDVVQIISSDAALTSRVLQLANSAAIRGNNEIVEVRQAVIRVGNKLTQSTAIAFAIRQAEKNKDLSEASRIALKKIWAESVELASRCYVITKEFTKLNADEALLTGLLSVLGKLYIFMKAEAVEGLSYTELESILESWHPAISKAIAESWNMSQEIINALESQLESNPALRETATLAEVLSAARLFLAYEASGEPMAASEYPLLIRLGIAKHDDTSVTLAEHAEAIDAVRQGLGG